MFYFNSLIVKELKVATEPLSEEAIVELKEKVSQGHSKSSIAKELNISRETLYQYLRGN